MKQGWPDALERVIVAVAGVEPHRQRHPVYGGHQPVQSGIGAPLPVPGPPSTGSRSYQAPPHPARLPAPRRPGPSAGPPCPRRSPRPRPRSRPAPHPPTRCHHSARTTAAARTCPARASCNAARQTALLPIPGAPSTAAGSGGTASYAVTSQLTSPSRPTRSGGAGSPSASLAATCSPRSWPLACSAPGPGSTQRACHHRRGSTPCR
jgi:hypothetical protein